MASDAEEALKLTIKQARTLITQGKGRDLLVLMKEADKDLGKRLVKTANERGSRFGDRFTDAKMLAYREQIVYVTKYVEMSLTGMTHQKVMTAMKSGTTHTVRVFKAYEKEYRGISELVRIDSQRVFENVGKKLTGSLLSRSKSSVERYGQAMIREFDLAMQRGLAQGLSQSEMITRLIKTAPPKLAKYLHDNEPRHFPDPKTGYMKKRYWAERIVRTETANAYNAANLASIEEMRNEEPNIKKKILAVMDKRTALDSVYVHGQVRDVDGLFHDGAGREYLRPPARPNDRETIIPWHDGWKETASSKPKTLQQIQASEAAKEATTPVPARPPGLMVAAVKERMARTKQSTFGKQKSQGHTGRHDGPKPGIRKASKTPTTKRRAVGAAQKQASQRRRRNP